MPGFQKKWRSDFSLFKKKTVHEEKTHQIARVQFVYEQKTLLAGRVHIVYEEKTLKVCPYTYCI